MQTQEQSDEDQQVLRDGLRMLARLIARHHLAEQPGAGEESGAPVSADADPCAAQSERNPG